MQTASLARKYSLVGSAAVVIVFTFLMAGSAYLRIPLFFTPVPLTLQTLVLYLSLPVLKKKAGLSQVLYVFLGISGFAVFTNGGAGFLYLLGPTGGYLLGFLSVAFVFPYFLPERTTYFKSFLFFSLAAGLIYFCGLSWLILFHHFSVPAALTAGFYPFIPSALIKIAIASIFSVNYARISTYQKR